MDSDEKQKSSAQSESATSKQFNSSMMQELQEIASSFEIMGKSFMDIAKKMKVIKVRVQGDKYKKKRVPTAYNCFVKSQVRKGANMKVVREFRSSYPAVSVSMSGF